MKRIITITLTALLAGCTSSSYTTNITTESSEEVYQVSQTLEQEVTTFEETELTAEVEKPVVKLTPEETVMVKSSESEIKILPPTQKQKEMHNRYGYTLQILALSRKTDLSSYTGKLPSDQPVWMNRKTVNNMPWYTILYGDFATPAEARKAIHRLPAEIQAYGPFVRSINSIKSSDNPELHKLN